MNLLSILYLRCIPLDDDLVQYLERHAFNSLFEMLIKQRLEGQRRRQEAFNSLFEMHEVKQQLGQIHSLAYVFQFSI